MTTCKTGPQNIESASRGLYNATALHPYRVSHGIAYKCLSVNELLKCQVGLAT